MFAKKISIRQTDAVLLSLPCMSQNIKRSKLTIRGCFECVVWLLRVGFVFYLVVCVVMAIFQRRLIYTHPAIANRSSAIRA
jgi:hypothetical protein